MLGAKRNSTRRRIRRVSSGGVCVERSARTTGIASAVGALVNPHDHLLAPGAKCDRGSSEPRVTRARTSTSLTRKVSRAPRETSRSTNVSGTPTRTPTHRHSADSTPRQRGLHQLANSLGAPWKEVIPWLVHGILVWFASSFRSSVTLEGRVGVASLTRLSHCQQQGSAP